MYFLSLFFFTACQESSNEPLPVQEECAHLDQGGIVGRVYFSTGDGMPGPGNEDGSAGISSSGLQTTIALYAPIESGSVPEIYAEENPEMYGVFDLSEHEPIATTESDEQGCFSFDVDPGEYSYFAEHEGGWYCNGFTGYMCHLNYEGGSATMGINIDYMVSY